MRKIIEDTANEIEDVKQEELFFTLLNGKSITEEIETSRGKFVVKFPKQKDLLAIDRKCAIMRAGIPASSFDENANFNIQKVAFLDVTVTSGETWFTKLKNDVTKNFSWGDMPDSNFVDEVWVKAWTFRNKIQESFGQHEKQADNKSTDGQDVQATLDDGLFSGITDNDK